MNPLELPVNLLRVDILPPRPLGYRERRHIEREVDDAVHARLVALYGSAAVVRQYRGWRRSDGVRAGHLPDLLVVAGDPWDEIAIIEVKARAATPADVRQLGRYVALAEAMPGHPLVLAVLAAPAFSASVPAWVRRWPLQLVAAS